MGRGGRRFESDHPDLYEVYIIRSTRTGGYYVGSSQNAASRLKDHNLGNSAYTRKGMPWALVYVVHFASRAEAVRLEHRIKARGIKRYLIDIGREPPG